MGNSLMDNQAFKLLVATIDEIKDDVKLVRSDLESVKKDIGHYKGFIGGVVFVFGVVWSGITYFFSGLKS